MPRTLAHLYHFYLHGERGNRGPGSGSESEGGTKTGNTRAQPAAPKVSVRLMGPGPMLPVMAVQGFRHGLHHMHACLPMPRQSEENK